MKKVKNMKRLWTTLIIFGLVTLGATTMVSAQGAQNGYQNALQYRQRLQNRIQMHPTTQNGLASASDSVSDDMELEQSLQLKERLQIRNQEQNKYPKARFRGIWGFADDNTTQGYLGGIAGKREHGGYLKGLWNTTDNTSKGTIAGILKKGFFNGRFTTGDGASYPITGFYRIDRENKLMHIRWMTLNKVGWAHLKIGAPEDSPSVDVPLE